MSGVVAGLIPVDEDQEHLRRNIALRVCPIAGDTIKLGGGAVVRVTRREIVEIFPGRDDVVDVYLSVRQEKAHGL